MANKVASLDSRPTKVIVIPSVFAFATIEQRNGYFETNPETLTEDLYVSVGADVYQYDSKWKLVKEDAIGAQSIIPDEGSQYTYSATAEAVSGTVVLRSHTGQILVGAPFEGGNAVNKQYVDQQVGQVGFVETPLTATSTGIAGQKAYDATHFYVCVATDTWVRADLATWV